MLKPKSSWHTALFLLSLTLSKSDTSGYLWERFLNQVGKLTTGASHLQIQLYGPLYNDGLQTNIKDTLAVLYHLKVQKSEKTSHGCPLNYH